MATLIKDKARADADRILDEFWSPSLFPVDPAQIALKMGLRVYQADLDPGTSGMILKLAGEPAEIYFASGESAQRQNFTCAHELGHFVERQYRERPDDEFEFVDRRNGAVNAHEFYANEFAGNLLMPADDMRSEVWFGASDADLARRYGVSQHAVRVRRMKLGIGS
ncbi:ImmA/IrrE family metallo-endopeptidase [Pseudarthrobacter sp. AG30]|uniref:ImmA/IrrE family metallo-endopeptidase n=1 Tax=Pseudarthrobacter sp. AG30 TaxID=2249742 RepID=UPI000D6DEDC6|nr:ImmA/IrrE family metallo-endopeptidase [Pseudarthrobacter sp. AG30]RAX15987.1 ImmA/IrrE family metallo-endopeptidase [Pseudarthrobacter sp. AG30]